MRTYSTTGLTIEYPDNIAFCFNRMLVNIYGEGLESMNIVRAQVSIAGEGNVAYTDEREPFNNKIYFFIEGYVQALFDNAQDTTLDYGISTLQKSPYGHMVTVTLTLFDAHSSVFEYSFDIYTIWGVMHVGEKFRNSRQLTWFRQFPFTVGIYSATVGGKVMVKEGDAEPYGLNLEAQALWNIALDSMTDSDTIEFFVSKYYSTFDLTFDNSFIYAADEDTTIVCKADDCTKGVYLRWVNRVGIYCYYLFQHGDETREVQDEGSFILNSRQDAGFIRGHNGGYGRQQQKTEIDTLPICVPLVDSDTYDFLFGVITSPVVDMYMGKDEEGLPQWCAVNITADKFVKTKESLQDFTCTLELPQISMQSL